MKTSKTNLEDPKTENTELIKPITNGFVTPITDIPLVRSQVCYNIQVQHGKTPPASPITLRSR